MAEGGYDRLPEWDDEDTPGPPDDDDADETRPFLPSSSSTPAPEFQTAQKEKSSFPDLPEVPWATSFSEELTALPSLLSTTTTAEGEIDKEFLISLLAQKSLTTIC